MTDASPSSTATSSNLAPFRESKSRRDEQHQRANNLISAVTSKLNANSNSSSVNSPTSTIGNDIGISACSVRPLTRREVSTLEGPGCSCKCEDWSKVLVITTDGVGSGTDLSAELRGQICTTTFAGWVLLGVNIGNSTSSDDSCGSPLKPGVRRNDLVSNCILEPGCTVQGNTFIDRTHVCPDASIINCGSVTFASDSSFADEMEITIGAESGGGRDVRVHVESTLVDVCHKLGMGSQSTSSSHFHYNHYKPTKLIMNTICRNASILHSPMVTCVYLSPHSSIDAATSVSNVILLPESKIAKSCTVDAAYLQWKATITTNSSVSSTVLMECSEIGPNSFVSSTVLGPDSHLSAGECHHSLLGPNTNSHHQSLLISVLWPLGRGNVGYGANVGSNHTGRLPDQEVCAGEGTFWGLGSVVKMPVNLCDAPFTVVAAGVELSPQRVGLPFSLVLSGTEQDGGGGLNQILPGWVLQSSPYTIARSEAKFANRRKAKRHAWYTGWCIIRPSTIDMCWHAREELVKAGNSSLSSQPSGQNSLERARPTIYKSESIHRLGQNYITENGRRKGILAYTNVIQLYALRGLLLKVEKALKMCHKSFGDEVAPRELERRMEGILSLHRNENCLPRHEFENVVLWPSLPWDESNERHILWNHQRTILKMEIPSLLSQDEANLSPPDMVVRLLERLIGLETDFADRVFKSKRRDDTRGDSILPGYLSSHTCAEEDTVVEAAVKECQRVERSISEIRSALSGHASVVSRL
eukprot:CAMPEP_0178673422 /NCGR_PEP_ID=MMETSP0698-20121128/34295_1 /TAXON_ID=265572 /ORGANISM="Extubocellulus spinifer, Strain CCMP396" /LENGTH=755 /DNA_ID=CAMNT_0020317435 /DNA_START=237 /DNA_END=2504 /DNA_ORIENTATION=+